MDMVYTVHCTVYSVHDVYGHVDMDMEDMYIVDMDMVKMDMVHIDMMDMGPPSWPSYLTYRPELLPELLI